MAPEVACAISSTMRDRGCAPSTIDIRNGNRARTPTPNVEYPSKLPAISFVDAQCSYASNEIAINWNAPLIYALAKFAEGKPVRAR